jgi:hypothetical protein
MKSRLLLDVVVRKSAAVLKLLSGKDETLLIWGNTFLILDLSLHVIDRVRRLNIKSNGLSSKSLDEDLHTSTQAKDQMKSRLLLDVVVRESAAVLKLLSGKDETLLIWGNTFLILDLSLHVIDRVRGLNIKSDGLPSKSLDEDLHTSTQAENQMKSRLLLDVVVRESSAVLKLLSSKDETLLIWGNTFLILDLGLHVIDRVGRFDIESDGLSGKSLYENLS